MSYPAIGRPAAYCTCAGQITWSSATQNVSNILDQFHVCNRLLIKLQIHIAFVICIKSLKQGRKTLETWRTLCIWTSSEFGRGY